MRLPSSPGLYVLLLRLPARQEITVGRLGRFVLPAGWYAYVGSARGAGGLAARVARHLRQGKVLHWHIDYLRARSNPLEVWYACGKDLDECGWATALGRLPGASLPAPRFGSSDCRCAAHLVHFRVPPDVAALADLVGEQVSVLTLPCESISSSC